MRNPTIVKVMAYLIANILLTVAVVGNAGSYTMHDVTPTESSGVYVVNESSSFDISGSGDSLSTTRSLDIKVTNADTLQPEENVNVTVISMSEKRLNSLGEQIELVFLILVVAMVVAFASCCIITGGLCGVMAVMFNPVTIAMGLGIGVGFTAVMSQIKDISTTDNLISGSDGKTQSLYQDAVNHGNMVYYVYLGDLDKYYDFPTSCTIYNANAHNSLSIFVKPRTHTDRPYAPSPYNAVQKDIGLFEGMVYAPTEDRYNYEDTDTYFKPIDVYKDGTTYGLNPASWQAKIMNRTSDVTLIESRRLIYIQPDAFNSVDEDSVHIEVSYWIGDKETSLGRGDPSGAISFNYTEDGYWQTQWVWTIGVMDLNKPITVEAFVNYTTISDGKSHVINAGTELVTLLGDESYTIEFQYPNQNLIGDVSHRVVCDRIYPVVISDMKWSFYPLKQGYIELSHISTSGFQSIIPIYKANNTNASFYNQECNYTQYIQIVDNDGTIISSSAENDSHFYSWKLTGAQADVVTNNVSKETAYSIQVMLKEWGVEYSRGLYYQLTDWDNHNNLSEQFKAYIEKIFKEGHIITDAELTQLQSYITQMKIKIDLLQAELRTLISSNGDTKYTDYCQKDIDNFNKIQTRINGLLDGKTATDFNNDAGKRAELKTACEKLLKTFNLAFLDYSSAVADSNGQDDVSRDLEGATEEDRNDIIIYIDSFSPNWWDGILDMLPFFIILLASLGIGTGVAYVVRKSGWHSGDDRDKKILALGVFITVTIVSFIAIGYLAGNYISAFFNALR